MSATKFYGEWVPYENQEEYEEACTYLKVWKKIFFRKLPADAICVDEQLVHHPIGSISNFNGDKSNFGTVGLKIEVSLKNNHGTEAEELRLPRMTN